MDKKIGFVSVCRRWSRLVAESAGIPFIVFNEFVEDCFEQKNLRVGKDLVKDVLLPCIELLGEKRVVLFDMETLIHDKAVVALKRMGFELCWLKRDFDKISDMADAAEGALKDEYEKRLLMICESAVDFDKLGTEEGVKCVIKKI